MLRFAKEIVCVVVHGLLMVLFFYAVCYNLKKEHWGRVAFYGGLFVVECVAVWLHIDEAFKEDGHDRQRPQ